MDSAIIDKKTNIIRKPVVFFTIADDKNLPYAKNLEKSFKHFHKDIDFLTITGDELQAYLQADKDFFYRSTPIIAEKLIKDYELVVKIDADSIVLGDLSYIWKTKDYDVATVINWNRKDPQQFGLIGGWGILPTEYMNAGLVVMRSERFIKNWRRICFTLQFSRLQFREQDILNGMIYYGDYNVRCLDYPDKPAGMCAWWGLISKGEWLRAKVVEDKEKFSKKVVVPKGEGDKPFPNADTEIKIIHVGGGNTIGNKMNYKTWFGEDVIERINYLFS